MHAKIARLNLLLGEGFEVVDIRSDDRVIEALLARDGARERVLFDREDARRILYDAGAWMAGRKAAAPLGGVGGRSARGGASRFRVTGPLR